MQGLGNRAGHYGEGDIQRGFVSPAWEIRCKHGATPGEKKPAGVTAGPLVGPFFLSRSCSMRNWVKLVRGDLVVGAKSDRDHEMGASLCRLPMQCQKDTEIAMSLEVRGVQRDCLSQFLLGVLLDGPLS